MTGEPMHTTSKERNGAINLSYHLSSDSETSIMLCCQLHIRPIT